MEVHGLKWAKEVCPHCIYTHRITQHIIVSAHSFPVLRHDGLQDFYQLPYHYNIAHSA